MSYRPIPTGDADHDSGDLTDVPLHGSPTTSIGNRASSPTLMSPASLTKILPTTAAGPPAAVPQQPAFDEKPHLKVTTSRPTSPVQVSVNIGQHSATPSSEHPPTRAFIRIVGLPSGIDPNDAHVDTVVVHSANITSPKPTIPQLSPTTAAGYMVDIIDAENEDPFTLEPFESLLELCAEKGKDFILARVVTVDPHDEHKFYHSYYAAHHINKVLFRTQPEEGLLHRMKAKNPLNNMTIVGDVHYYIITPKAYQEARAHMAAAANVSPASPAGSVKSSRAVNLFGRPKRPRTLAEYIHDALFPPEPVEDRRKLRLVVTDPTRVLDGSKPAGSQRRPSADDIYAFVSRSSPTEPRGPGLEEVDIGRLAPPPKTTSPATDARLGGAATAAAGSASTASIVSRHKRSKSTSAAHASPTLPLPGSGPGSPKGTRYDWLSEFRAKSRRAAGATSKVKVRSVSYRNERLADDAHMLSVEEWVSVHCDVTMARVMLEHPSSNTGQMPPIDAMGPRRRSKGQMEMSQLVALKKGTEPGSKIAVASASKATAVLYEAQFYGTDDDFLMKSTVRSYFKSQAVEADDAVLFSIPSTTTVILPNGEEQLEPHPALDGFGFAIDGDDDSESDRSGLLSPLRTLVRGNNALKTVLLFYIVAGTCLVVFIVPPGLTYLVIFLLVFILAFFLVFCVEADF